MKAKRLISLISAVTVTAGLMLSALQYNIPAKEAEETEEKELFVSGDFEYYLNEDGTVTISDYSGEAEELQLPYKINGYMVSAIGAGAFFLCGDLRSIEIPDSVISIDDWAFSGCSSLLNIHVSPDNPCFVYEENALYKKDTKEIICVPAGLGLKEFVIPEGITGITGAFTGCDSLTDIDIPDSVTSIGDSAFYGCSSLKSIEIPDSVTRIGDSAFYDCSSLTDIRIPDSVTSIGEWAFGWCSSLKSIKIPDSITSIGDGTFNDCSSLTNISIPDSIKRIGDLAFYGCSSLKSIELPDSVTNIGDWVFYWCEDLTATVSPGSYAEQYCMENRIEYTYTED